ncbi:MAG: glycosyltransferase family 2 protein [Gemmatimonadota bacterium]
MTPSLAVVILQYGNWRQTVACLQSLVPSVHRGDARVIVVDNASPDDSVMHLQRWMHGELAAMPRPVHDTVAPHWWPLAGAGTEWSGGQSRDSSALAPWTLLQSGQNHGFAAGMNAGIRCALADGDVNAVWLLNNDTVVDADAVRAIRAALEETPAKTGQFGTTVLYYDRPTIVQSVGWCRWNAWLAAAHRVHDGANVAQPLLREARQPGYVYGASWILRATALRDVGLLSEEGFLYGEELDWSCRAAGSWTTALIADAIVWHREGATIGARAESGGPRSELADLCGISARLRLTRRFFPSHLPAVYSGLMGAALNRLRRGDPRRAAAVARLVLRGGEPAPRPADAGASHSSTTP